MLAGQLTNRAGTSLAMRTDVMHCCMWMPLEPPLGEHPPPAPPAARRQRPPVPASMARLAESSGTFLRDLWADKHRLAFVFAYLVSWGGTITTCGGLAALLVYCQDNYPQGLGAGFKLQKVRGRCIGRASARGRGAARMPPHPAPPPRSRTFPPPSPPRSPTRALLLPSWRISA